MESAVYEIIVRAISDPDYRELLISAPKEAMDGYDLSDEEKAAIEATDHDASKKFFEMVDSDIYQFHGCGGCGCGRCGGCGCGGGCGGCGCGCRRCGGC